jgi:hypothetical protein
MTEAGDPMKRWEYLSIQAVGNTSTTRKDGTDDVLNDLGAQGWELCGVIGSSAQGHARGIGSPGTLIFKREVAESW